MGFSTTPSIDFRSIGDRPLSGEGEQGFQIHIQSTSDSGMHLPGFLLCSWPRYLQLFRLPVLATTGPTGIHRRRTVPPMSSLE